MPPEKPTVLLVDVDETIVYDLPGTLRRQPFRLYAARSANEAVSILASSDVDVIVADEWAGDVAGNRLLAWVEANCPETVRVELTSREDRAKSPGQVGSAQLVLLKTCSAAQLVQTIRKALDLRTRLRKAASRDGVAETAVLA
ncbi:MAG: hypothetical protein NUV77_12250 [Thermoguttaceae bacterium]|jgi:DNA-binding NtrC family response regulator|nr:hypothetical protein [Thermoguttaceae bacterium]